MSKLVLRHVLSGNIHLVAFWGVTTNHVTKIFDLTLYPYKALQMCYVLCGRSLIKINLETQRLELAPKMKKKKNIFDLAKYLQIEDLFKSRNQEMRSVL